MVSSHYYFCFSIIFLSKISFISSQIFLSSGVEFKFMTLEHNSHYDPAFRDNSRKLLLDEGYALLFGDVLSGQRSWRRSSRCSAYRRLINNGIAIEDWWVNLNFFNKKVLNSRKDKAFSEECFFQLFNVAPEDALTSGQLHEYLL